VIGKLKQQLPNTLRIHQKPIHSYHTQFNSAVKNYVEPKSTIKQSDLDIKDNQIELLKEDLEVVHMYLDGLLPRKDGEWGNILNRWEN